MKKSAQLNDPQDSNGPVAPQPIGGAHEENRPRLALNVRNSPAPGTGSRGAHRPFALAHGAEVGVMPGFRRLGLVDGRSSFARGRFLGRVVLQRPDPVN